MKKIYIITILTLFVYLFSCGSGPPLGVPDYKIAYVPNDENPAIYVMNSDGTDKTLIYWEPSETTTIFHNLFWDVDNNIYYTAGRPWYFAKHLCCEIHYIELIINLEITK